MKTKIALISAVLMCLFLSSGLTTKALTQIDRVIYPETIKLGKTLEIEVVFDYSSRAADCLYGNYIWIYYRFNDDPYTDFFNNYKSLTVNISDLPNFPRPAIVVAKINTSDVTYDIDDIFLFKIKYINGYESGDTIYDSGTILSEFYEITSVKEASLSATITIIPLLILSTTVLIRNKKIKTS